MDLRCLTFSLSTLQMNVLPSDSFIKIKKKSRRQMSSEIWHILGRFASVFYMGDNRLTVNLWSGPSWFYLLFSCNLASYNPWAFCFVFHHSIFDYMCFIVVFQRQVRGFLSGPNTYEHIFVERPFNFLYFYEGWGVGRGWGVQRARGGAARFKKKSRILYCPKYTLCKNVNKKTKKKKKKKKKEKVTGPKHLPHINIKWSVHYW